MSTLTEQELKGKKKDDLVRLCKERNLPFSGTKDILTSRLLGKPPPAAKPRKTKAVAPRAAAARPPPRCFDIVSTKYIHARKNEYGNYEDPVSHLVFDPKTTFVLGRQSGAEIIKLSIEDVKFCREKGLQFEPSVFDGNFVAHNEDIETTIERLIAEGDADAGGDDASETDED
jgi:hypothetical protein